MSKVNENTNRIELLESGLKEIAAYNRNQESRISDLRQQICCGIVTGHCFTLDTTYGRTMEYNPELVYFFRCIHCGLKYDKSKKDFNKRELDLVAAVKSK